MTIFTAREVRLAAFVVAAALIGYAVQHFRAAAEAAPAISETTQP